MSDRSSARGRGLLRATRGAGLLLALAGVGVSVGSCAPAPRPYTRMLVVIDTDLQSTEIDRIEFTTCPGGGDDSCAVRAVLPLTDGALSAVLPGHPQQTFAIPGSIALEPTAGDDAPTQLRLVGRRGEAEVSRRVVRTRFVAGQTVVVPMFLSRRCASLCPSAGANIPRAVCRAGDPCAGGAVCEAAPAECGVAVEVPPQMLPSDAGPDAEFMFATREAGADATEPPADTVTIDERPAPDVVDATDAMDAMDVFDAPDGRDSMIVMPDVVDVRDGFDADAVVSRDVVDVVDVATDMRVQPPDMGPIDAPVDVPPRDAVVVDAGVCPPGQRAGCAEICVDPLSDPLNCGGCDQRCQAPPNAYGRCTAGVCRLGEYDCAPGFADCNHVADDGCEVDLRNDPVNCRVCGNVCPGVAPGAIRSCNGTTGTATACGATCGAGTALVPGTEAPCVATVPVISPQSGAVLTGSRRPVFRWGTAAGVSNVQLQLCSGGVNSSGACQSGLTTQIPTGQVHTSNTPLAAGTYNWRLSYVVTGAGTRYTPWREFFLVTRSDNMSTVSGLSNYRLDFDRDGRSDVMIPALRGPGFVDSEVFAGAALSRAYVYLGRSAPPSSGTGVSVAPDATLVGTSRAFYFCVSGGPAGDVNGDGYGDLVMGGADSFVVHAGGPDGPQLGPLSTVYTPSLPVVAFAGAGDVNLDGYGDVVALHNEGVIRIYMGGPQGVTDTGFVTLVRPEGRPTLFTFTGGFDANGDGFNDVAAAASSTSAVWVWLSSGAPLTAMTEPVQIVRESDPGGRLDDTVEAMTAGDINGDGFGDLILGYQNRCSPSTIGSDCDHEGGVVIRFGATGANTFTIARELTRTFVPARDPVGALFGYPLETGADLNGDGILDLAVGARLADQVQFYLGQSSMSAPPPNLSLSVRGPGLELVGAALLGTYAAGGAPMVLLQVEAERDEGVRWYRVSGTGPTLELTDTARRPAVTASTGGYAGGGLIVN